MVTEFRQIEQPAELTGMQAELESYLRVLCQRAKEWGASDAVAMSVTDIVVDERTRLKCLVPLCPSYGKNLTCPPHVMSVSEFKNILKNYHGAILVKVDVALPEPSEQLAKQNDLPEVWKMAESVRKGTNKASALATEYLHALRDAQEKLNAIVSHIESAGIAQGYPFVAGLGAGSCQLCDECVAAGSGLPCRHPFRARPSMEALGINVVATATNAGIPLNFVPNGRKSWLGLILVD